MGPYVLISADCHAGLPMGEYREWLDADVRPAFDDHLVQRRRVLDAQRGSVVDAEFADRWHHDHEESLAGGWDAARRDVELGNDGVAGEVIFPDADAVTGGASAPFGAGLGMSGHLDPSLAMAGAKAHNRWLAELCADSPDRRAGIAIVPILHDVPAAVAEIRRARMAGLRGGILIPSVWEPYVPYYDHRYDPVWAVCSELGMPVHVHSGTADTRSYGGNMGLYVSEMRWWSSRPLQFLIWSGVFERFPELRFVVTECGTWWVPDLLWLMDVTFEREHGTKKLARSLTDGLAMRPSEYFDRNCWLGASNPRRRELARRYEIGVANLMWANDFPHPEGTWPNTRAWLRSVFCDLPIRETAAILGGNAAELYGFDVDRLRHIADTIGPEPEDLGQSVSHDDAWSASAAVGRPWITGLETRPPSQAHKPEPVLIDSS